MSFPKSNNYLEIDNSLMEKNLRIVKNEFEENFNQYFGSGESPNPIIPPRDYKIVQPKPGFCIKTFKVNTDEKYFVNVCQTPEIPPPEDLTDEELTEILSSDETSSFRIPMSISEPRISKDKSNNPVEVVDIAVHPNFFAKLQKSLIYHQFFLALMAEALNDKYNVQIKMDKVIVLNNRKVVGTLVQHRVRNSDVKAVRDSTSKALLTTSGNSGMNRKTPLIQELDQSSSEAQYWRNRKLAVEKKSPEYKLRARLNQHQQVEEVQAEFYLPKCITSRDLNLDVGGDRIVLQSMKHGYHFDKFVDYCLNPQKVDAIFDQTHKMLQVRIGVLKA